MRPKDEKVTATEIHGATNPGQGCASFVTECLQPALETDRNLRILQMNQAAQLFLGCRLSDVQGQFIEEAFLIPEAGRNVPGSSGKPESGIFRVRRRNRSHTTIALTACPLSPTGGVFFVICDLSESFPAQQCWANEQAKNIILSSITGRLLDTKLDDFEEDIANTLHSLGMFFNAQSCYLCCHQSGREFKLCGSWCQNPSWGIDASMLHDITAQLPGVLGLLKNMQTLHWCAAQPDPGFGEQGIMGREYLKLRRADAAILVPLILGHRLLGFFACERHGVQSPWPQDEVIMLRSLAETISSTMGRLDAERKLFEHSQYMSLVMETLQTGVMVSHAGDGQIVSVNRYARELLAAPQKKILDSKRGLYLEHVQPEQVTWAPKESELESSEWILHAADGRNRNVLRTAAMAKRQETDYLVECFSDISTLKRLLEYQALDIDQAKRLLRIVQGPGLRHLELNQDVGLFTLGVSHSCMEAGGDHYFVRELPPDSLHAKGSVHLSLKDESGHQVGCVLRSVINDYLHLNLLSQMENHRPEFVVEQLNRQLCEYGYASGDDFSTGMVCHIDKATGAMKYVSCGHPPLLLIRDGQVETLPAGSGKPGSNRVLGFLADQSYIPGEVQLQPGDRLILYTDGLFNINRYARRTGASLTVADFSGLVQRLVAEEPGQTVDDLVTRILAEIISLGALSLKGDKLTGNDDDITFVGLELEDLTWQHEEVWRPGSLDQLQKRMDGYYAARKKEWLKRGFEKPHRLKLCLEEAIANAYLHGNRAAADKDITIRHRYGNDFHIQITDSGSGFAWQELRPADCLDKPLKDSGRGTFLIMNRASQVNWNESGNRVSLALPKRDL